MKKICTILAATVSVATMVCTLPQATHGGRFMRKAFLIHPAKKKYLCFVNL